MPFILRCLLHAIGFMSNHLRRQKYKNLYNVLQEGSKYSTDAPLTTYEHHSYLPSPFASLLALSAGPLTKHVGESGIHKQNHQLPLAHKHIPTRAVAVHILDEISNKTLGGNHFPSLLSLYLAKQVTLLHHAQ